MSEAARRSLVVCYVPGLDRRRITPEATPFAHGLVSSRPTVTLETLPSTELLPTLLTGVYPDRHGVRQVRLRPGRTGGAPASWFERLPDALTTTLQGLRQMSDPTFDLATVPPRRRNAFVQYRFKYTRRERSDQTVLRFAAYDTVLGLLGDRARYAFAKRFDRAREILPDLVPPPGTDRALRMLELYALDLFQHWHLDRPDRMEWALGETDAFLADLEAACRRVGATFLLLVDHGQELVTRTIPLAGRLERTDLAQSEYSYFLEVAQGRFWFHTGRARRVIESLLESLPHTTWCHHSELERYHLRADDDTWGEVVVFADPGSIFFPHDFYRPLANLYLGLADPYQRPRVADPRHRGNHGYLPGHPSERGFVTLASDAHRVASHAGELTDVAPTILELLGEARPAHMEGRPLFRSIA